MLLNHNYAIRLLGLTLILHTQIIYSQVQIQEKQIGSQVWMIVNLNTTTFRNGDTIQEANNEEEWKSAGEQLKPACCNYQFNSENGNTYGKLYNWFAVQDQRGLCPAGWHMPIDEDWIELTEFLEEEDSPGKQLKSSSGWAEQGNGNNASGFSALPGGSSNYSGTFSDLGNFGMWWSANQENESTAWLMMLEYTSGIVNRSTSDKSYGMSVRCLKDK